jgi:tyrosyl-tRNA synthetase
VDALEAVGREVPTTSLPADRLADTVDVLVTTGLASSRSEARRLLDQRGVRANGRPVGPDETLEAIELLHGRFVLLRKGKHTYHLVEISAGPG